MQIQNGKLYENRTWKYVFPCLKFYGEDLTNYLKSFFKLAVGLGDTNYEEKSDGSNIFILIETSYTFALQRDTDRYRENFARFLDWVRYMPFYVTDYVYEGINDREQHMLVLKIPDRYRESIKHFKKGRYSKMYTPKEINSYFGHVTLNNKQAEVEVNNRLKKTRAILNKSKEYLEDFVKEVNNKFKTNATLEDFKDAELDFPPNPEEEVFSYQSKKIKV